MKKTKNIIFLSIIFLIAIFVASCGGASDGDKTIKIGNAPYDYEDPPIEITKQIAEELGYEIEVVEGDVGFMFLSLVQGDIDIWPGVWLPSLHETYHEENKDDYELGSVIYQSALSGLTVPEYVEIESLDDLKGNEHLFNNKLTGIEPGSGLMLRAEKFIEDYDLDLELVSGSTSSMLAEVDYATTQEEPILFLGWRPHAMFQKYDLKGLEDPDSYFNRDYFQWGINEDFEEKAPDLYRYVNNFEMDVEDMEEFLYEIEAGTDLEELVTEWIEENRSDIDDWLGE